MAFPVVRALLALPVLALAGAAAAQSAPPARPLPMDANGDGVVTAQEHAEGARRVFEQMDANHDGKATREEMIAFQQKVIRAQQAARGAPSPAPAATPPPTR